MTLIWRTNKNREDNIEKIETKKYHFFFDITENRPNDIEFE